MSKLTPEEMASKLQAEQFHRLSLDAEALSDPIRDTPSRSRWMS